MKPSCLIFLLCVATTLTGCRRSSSSEGGAKEQVNAWNEQAYRWFYRDVDSVRAFAAQALTLAEQIRFRDGAAEALNNLAYERFQQMDFDSVLVLTRQAQELSNAPTEQLVAEVLQMKVAQRTSENVSFFQHRSRALRYIERLANHSEDLSPHLYKRFNYGAGETHIVASTYFYYLDQRERAIAEIKAAEPYCQMAQDSALWLNYCYMRGSGGLSEQTNVRSVAHEEFGYLAKCFWLARYEGFRFFEANAEQSLATLFADSLRLSWVEDAALEQVALIRTVFGDDATAQALAEAAYENFVLYDDLYQEACALRTLGEYAFSVGEYEDAVQFYAKALSCVNLHHLCYYAPDAVLEPEAEADLLQTFNPKPEQPSVERRWIESGQVKTVPEWIAGIRQQLSVAYSALDCKAESDYNRNIYLDLLDITREDAELESRVAELAAESKRIRLMVVLVVLLAIIVGGLTLYLIRINRRRTEVQRRLLNQRFQQLNDSTRKAQEALSEEQEQVQEQRAVTELRLQRNKRLNIEKRAKLQLVYGIMPFLDRIINEVHRMQRRGQTSEESMTYIGELTDRIIAYNSLLTEWIQMEQGLLSLQLTSFPLQPLFDSLRKSHFSFDRKGVKLEVEPTTLSVKADRSLTLFMLNTLMDNARKFTPEGGQVSVSAQTGTNDDGHFVELSVTDTGIGLAESDIEMILKHPVYDASKIGLTEGAHQGQKGFGFGLMNCKGIMEKYRKTSDAFKVCRMGIESRVGEGSRFWFRLPLVRVVTMILLVLTGVPAQILATSVPSQAYALADSVYFSNVEGRYADALHYADSAFAVMGTAADSVDDSLVLGLHNEAAVASLALHDWKKYQYHNQQYTRLFKFLNRDTTLESYCQQTEQSQVYQRWALVLIVLLSLSAAASVYLFYIQPRVRFRKAYAQLSAQRLRQMQQSAEAEHERLQEDLEMAEDEYRRKRYEDERLHVQNQIIDNCLSTIKHETMFFPGHIQQLARRGGDLQTLSETASYYKEIYSLLSSQVAHQSEALNFRRQSLNVDDLLKAVMLHVQHLANRKGVQVALQTENHVGEARLRGDADLVVMLITSLVEAEVNMLSTDQVDRHCQLHLHIDADGSFVRFMLVHEAVQLTPEQLHTLFMPHEGAIPLLICKQIIREHDTFLGHPGCRINAETATKGHQIWFTLPLEQTHTAAVTS